MNRSRPSWLCALPFAVVFCLIACTAPKYTPPDLTQTRDPEELGRKSEEAYQQGKIQTDKEEKLKLAQAGIAYASRCLAIAPRSSQCLYYRALNTGIFIKNHIPNYQKGLQQMVADCNSLIEIQPDYEHGGAYRILGNIYAQAPSFSLNPKNVTQDLDKSVEYLMEAAEIDPKYPLNQLFLARSLDARGDKKEAKVHLEEFDRLDHSNLDSEYEDWEEERNKLAQKLLSKPS